MVCLEWSYDFRIPGACVVAFCSPHTHLCDMQESTIGASFLTQTVVVDDVTVKFEIWVRAPDPNAFLSPLTLRLVLSTLSFPVSNF